MKKQLLTLALTAALLPAFSASAEDAITQLWKTAPTEAFTDGWDNTAPNWSDVENIKSKSNPRFATAKDGKIWTIDQKTMSIAEVTKEGTLVPTYNPWAPDNSADFYGTAIAMDEVGNYLIGMNFTQRPGSSIRWAIYSPTEDKSVDFTLNVPSGWNIGRIDCVGRVLGDLTKDAVFYIVPETGYTSAVRIIEVKGDGTLDSVTLSDAGSVDVSGNNTQQNIAQPAYRTMAEAKAANGAKDFYYSSCNGVNNYYASYLNGTLTGDFATNMMYTTAAGTNGFDTFTVNGKRYFVRNWAQIPGTRAMDIVVMDANGNEIAKWINPDYEPNGGYSSIIAEPLEDKTVNIYVYNCANKLGAAAMLNFDPAKAGEAVEPEQPAGSSVDKPYVINTVEDLTAMKSNILSGEFYAILEADLDMTDVAFTPIVSQSTIYFDGHNHVISNMSVSNSNAAIFGDFKGTIKNLGVENVSNTSDTWGLAAPLIAYVAKSGTALIENCYASGEVSGFYAGGLVAGVNIGGTATIRNCYSTVNVNSVNGYCGGIVGPCNDNGTLTVENAYSAGDINAFVYGGGIAPGMTTSGTTSTITLNNVATFSSSIKGGKGVDAILLIDPKFTSTVNNSYVSDGTSINDAAATETTPAATIITTIQGWSAFSNTALDETTGLPLLAWQAGEDASVAEIEADDTDAPAVYYNLQGVQVANPESGIYIVRRGNKVTKELVK